MEEVSKYQSIQDRIKRLTKNQSSSSPVATVDKLHMLSNEQHSQKQSMNRMNFAKKRQNSQNSIRTLITTREYALNNERAFDLISNIRADNTQTVIKQGGKQFRKTPNNYAIRKPMDDSNSRWDTNSYSLKRNDSIGNVLDRSVQQVMEKYSNKKIPTDLDENDYSRDKLLLVDGNKENTAIIRAQGIKKSQNNNPITHIQQYADMSYRRSMDDEGISKMIKCQAPAPQNQQYGFQRKIMTEMLPTQICNRQPEMTQMRSRIITRCKSGMIERMPGRIMKNK